jgi:hypothetical protein
VDADLNDDPFHPPRFSRCSSCEFTELVVDVKAHGLHEPTTLQGGQILDGRNHYRAFRLLTAMASRL